jgi:hypothetical protein
MPKLDGMSVSGKDLEFGMELLGVVEESNDDPKVPEWFQIVDEEEVLDGEG